MRKQALTAVMLALTMTAAVTAAAVAGETETVQDSQTAAENSAETEAESSTNAAEEAQVLGFSDFQKLVKPGMPLTEVSSLLQKYSGYAYQPDSSDPSGDSLTVSLTAFPEDTDTDVLTAEIDACAQNSFTEFLQTVNADYKALQNADGTEAAVTAEYTVTSGAADESEIASVKDSLDTQIRKLSSDVSDPEVTTDGTTETTVWTIPADSTLITDSDLYSKLTEKYGSDPILWETVTMTKTAAEDGTLRYQVNVHAENAQICNALLDAWKQNKTEPTTAETTTAEQTTAAESTTAEPTTAEQTTAESTTAEVTTTEPTTAEQTTAESSTAESTTAESTTAQETTTQAPELTEPQKRANQLTSSLNSLLYSGTDNPSVSFTFTLKDQITPEVLDAQLLQSVRAALQQVSSSDPFIEAGYVLSDSGSDTLYWYRKGAQDAVAVQLTPHLSADGVHADSVKVALILRKETAQNVTAAGVPFGLQIGSTESELAGAVGTSPYFAAGVSGTEGGENETIHYVICLPWSDGNAYVTVDTASMLYLQKMANDTKASYSTPAAKLLTGYTLYLDRVSDPAAQRKQIGTAAQAVWGTSLTENAQDETWHQEITADSYLAGNAMTGTEFWAKWGSSVTPVRTVDICADPDEPSINLVRVSAQNQAALDRVISEWDVTDTVDVSEVTVVSGTILSVNGTMFTLQPTAAGSAVLTLNTNSATIVTAGAAGQTVLSTGESVMVSYKAKSDGSLYAARVDIQ